ncbi:MAG: hypothetical protein M5U28_54430 [Sandaracinaceae bacterium]|nr:hypothetical protein [Sandaracinaceae bacterium]
MAQAQHLPRDSQPPDEPESSTPEGARDRPSDWGSLVADLSAGQRPAWRIHDRTHLEFAVDYPLDAGSGATAWEWEAYFFVPESLRLDGKTYDKQDIYADLQSYVRFAVPDVPFGELAGAALDELREVVRRGDSTAAVRELRLFACRVRAAGVQTRRVISEALEAGADARTSALAATARMVTDARRIVTGLREQIATLPEDDDTLRTAAAWVDEDVSRLVETLLGSLSVRLEKADAPAALRQSVVDAAVAEARYRSERGLEGGRPRRDRQARGGGARVPPPRPQALHLLGALAQARGARGRAHGPRGALRARRRGGHGLRPGRGHPQRQPDGQRAHLDVVGHRGCWPTWARTASRPRSSTSSRRWCRATSRIGAGASAIASAASCSARSTSSRPSWPSTASPRRCSPSGAPRASTLEEQARPEKVLWHRKLVRLSAEQVAEADPRFDALTEIFRLDLRRWLAHTDDPKRKIVFADPDEGRVCDAMAPRVYNIGVVYRLRRKDDDGAPWQRIRVVVSRKGIRRIDHIR